MLKIQTTDKPLVSRNICMRVKSLQSCLTLYNAMDYSLPVSSVYGTLQTSILEWVAIPFSRGSSWPRNGTQGFRIAGRFFTIWTAREALISFRVDWFDLAGIRRFRIKKTNHSNGEGMWSNPNLKWQDQFGGQFDSFLYSFKYTYRQPHDFTPHFIYLFCTCMACGHLGSQPGIEPTPPALEAWSLNHWTAKEVSHPLLLRSQNKCSHGLINGCSNETFLLPLHWKQFKCPSTGIWAN